MSARFRCLGCYRQVVPRTPILLFIVVALASAAVTQSQNGSLLGSIHDAEHQAIADAQVELTRVDSWQPVSKRFTDSSGHFGFAGLPAGEYSLKLTARGWQEQLFPHLQIKAARTLDVDIILIPASPNHGRQTGAIQLRDRDILVGSKYGDVPLHALPTTRR